MPLAGQEGAVNITTVDKLPSMMHAAVWVSSIAFQTRLCGGQAGACKQYSPETRDSWVRKKKHRFIHYPWYWRCHQGRAPGVLNPARLGRSRNLPEKVLALWMLFVGILEVTLMDLPGTVKELNSLVLLRWSNSYFLSGIYQHTYMVHIPVVGPR